MLLQLSAMVHNGWEFERTITQKIHAHQLRVCARVIHSSEYPAKGLKVVDGTAIRKGLWTRAGARYLKENGFEVLLAGRETEGRLTDWLREQSFLPTELKYYLCGSPEMVVEVRDILISRHIPFGQIISETYF